MAKQSTSIRIRPDLKDELEQRAREAGVSTASLYERFIEEGLRRDAHPLIAFADGAGGRRAVLVGSRLTVGQVVETIEAARGKDEARLREAAAYLGIPLSHVRACVRYYAQYRDDVDEWRRRTADAADREHESWQREQALFS